jgi:hypothetical protein
MIGRLETVVHFSIHPYPIAPPLLPSSCHSHHHLSMAGTPPITTLSITATTPNGVDKAMWNELVSAQLLKYLLWDLWCVVAVYANPSRDQLRESIAGCIHAAHSYQFETTLAQRSEDRQAHWDRMEMNRERSEHDRAEGIERYCPGYNQTYVREPRHLCIYDDAPRTGSIDTRVPSMVTWLLVTTSASCQSCVCFSTTTTH